MRILIFHGYLLRGTGSNVYNAELARALKASGHEVHLLCQDRDARSLEFVDAVGAWESGELKVEELGRTPEAGRCVVYRPPIADVLPVYVADKYDGFDARTFDQLSDEELEFYIARNVMAVRDVSALADPEAALANHMVMGPYILARAFNGKVPYAAKIHGSAMEYIVRPHPRFLPYAKEGVAAARNVLVGSRHIAERTWDTLQMDALVDHTYLGPPGVDVERFKPARRKEDVRPGLERAAERVAELPRDGYGPAAASSTASLFDRIRTAARTEGTLTYEDVAGLVDELHGAYDTAGIDFAAPERLRALAATEDPIVLYVGKLIVSKGVDLVLAAWPLVRKKHPNAQLLVTGFGAYREGLEMLLDALSEGDLVTARWIAAGGRAFEGGSPDQLNYVVELFDSLEYEARDDYIAAAKGMRDSVHWLGRLEHEVLAEFLPAATCQVVPSTFPEAFGMVAAEAAAGGVPPISAEHSGLVEVTRQLQETLSGASGSLLSFPIGSRCVEKLASRMTGLIGIGADERAEIAARLIATANERFSWTGVGEQVIAAATGQTDVLRKP